jgi:hypothetical protein
VVLRTFFLLCPEEESGSDCCPEEKRAILEANLNDKTVFYSKCIPRKRKKVIGIGES